MTDPATLLATVVEAQQQLSQLESTAKGLIEELASSGAQPTARLRELLATGERLVAAVQQAGGRLGSVLPPAGALPPGPDRAAVEAVWEKQLAEHEEPQLQPTPVSAPAGSLAELATSLRHLPHCRLELLDGRQPVQQPEQATAVLLHCGQAFVAVVQLQARGGMEPLRAGVLSTAEAAGAMAGGGSLWAPSQHAVFQQLSSAAVAALQHFLQQQQGQQQQRAGAASALELLLLWAATCGDVFSRRSTSTGTLLLTDPSPAGAGLLPPLRRPWQLSWQQLWQAALNPRLRRAEHTDATAGL